MFITSKSRRAFTLIELHVVIAIIAILAAILFPVFARAKAAAKASVSLSNSKQTSLAVLIYAADYDDNFVIGGQWHSSDPDAMKGYASSWYMPWTGLVDPYMKNMNILFSPFTTETRTFTATTYNNCNTPRMCRLLYPTYGYNIKYLSPTARDQASNPWQMTALSITAVVKPSEQVMLTENWSRNTVSWFAWSVTADFAYMSFASAEAPDGATGYDDSWPVPFGYKSWGAYSDSMNNALNSQEGKYTAGVAFRSPGLRTPVAFADGHVKSMGQEALAQGTDWVTGPDFDMASNLRNGLYLWDPRGE